MVKNDDRLRLKYEPEYDLLSAWIGAPRVADVVEVEPGFCIRISRDTHQVIGLEVMGAAARFKKNASAIQNHTFVRSLLERYGRAALARTA